MARQYGFTGWNQLRDEVEKIVAPGSGRFMPESSVEKKFRTICSAYEREDYELFCPVMNDTMRNAISEDHFKRVCESIAPYFKAEYTSIYFGEMSQGDHAVHFWRISSPDKGTDLMTRMGLKDDLVSGLLLSAPFAGAPGKSK